MMTVRVGISIRRTVEEIASISVREVKTLLKEQLRFAMRQLCGVHDVTVEQVIVGCAPLDIDDVQKVGVSMHCMEGKNSEILCISIRQVQSLLEEYLVRVMEFEYGELVAVEQVIAERDLFDDVVDDDIVDVDDVVDIDDVVDTDESVDIKEDTTER